MMNFNYSGKEESGYGARRHARWQKAKPYVIGFGIGLTLATCGRGCSSHAAEYSPAAVSRAAAPETPRPSLELLVR